MSDETRELWLTAASDVRSTRQRWLWSGRIPLGTVTVFAGRGGEGKSTFALHLGALASRGQLEGDFDGHAVPMLVLSHEDDWGTVMKPRLVAADADLDKTWKVAIRSTVDEVTSETIPAVPLDIARMRQAIEETGARLIILDPLTSTMSGDPNKLGDVRSALNPLSALAQELDIAVIAIMHLRKGGGNVSDLVSGSHAFRDVARSMLVFATDDESGDRVVTLDKSNYSQERGNSFAFRLHSMTVTTDDGDQSAVARVEYLGDTDRTASDIFNRPSGTEEDDRSENERWLIGYLEDAGGSAKAGAIRNAANQDGMSWDGIKRASRRITDKAKQGFQGSWTWTLDLTKEGTKGGKGAGSPDPAPFAPYEPESPPQAPETVVDSAPTLEI